MKLSPLLSRLMILLLLLASAVSDESSPLQDTCPTSTATAPGGKPPFLNGFPCKSPHTITASDFKSSKLNHGGDTDNFLRSSVNLVTALEFPGLNTLGLSMARTDLGVDGMVLPHSHPRASEMLYVAQGDVVAGFVDTANRLFQKSLGAGDVFVLPRGLLHFCFNAGYGVATVYSVLNSQNPGVASIAGAMFAPDSDVAERLVARMMDLRAIIYNS